MLMNITGGGSVRLQEKSVEPSSQSISVTPDAGYGGLSQVTVQGDAELIASNIRSGVTIFGVVGTGTLPTRTVEITANERLIWGGTSVYQSYYPSNEGFTGIAYRLSVFNMPMTGTGTGTSAEFTHGEHTWDKLYSAAIGQYQFYNKKITDLDVSALANKLMYLCPTGKTFTAYVTGIIAVVNSRLFNLAESTSNPETAGTIIITGSSTEYELSLNGVENIGYTSGYVKTSQSGPYYMGMVITDISYSLE